MNIKWNLITLLLSSSSYKDIFLFWYFFSIDPHEELIDSEMYVDVYMKQHEE